VTNPSDGATDGSTPKYSAKADYEQYLRRLPKVELHCHVEGTLRPATVVELAAKHKIVLPTTEVDEIYRYSTIYEFLEIYATVNSTVIDREDFARIAYETLQDGVELGNLKYREMFFNPTLHTARGIPMATVIDGLIDGAKAAETDFGVRCVFIADVYRQDPPEVARQMVEEVLAHRRPELIGLGMDAAEAPDPPEKFVEAYRVAKAAGLRLTSHCAEDGPAANVTTCLDLLGCERLDHGYHILEDPEVVARCRGEGITFTVCPTSTAVVYGWPDLTQHPITKMMDAGLRVMLNSDDPTMFHTDIGEEYVRFCGQNNYGPKVVRQLVLQGVDATWCDDVDKAAMRRAFEAEIDVLDRELLG
jgi:adenosine deaminase